MEEEEAELKDKKKPHYMGEIMDTTATAFAVCLHSSLSFLFSCTDSLPDQSDLFDRRPTPIQHVESAEKLPTGGQPVATCGTHRENYADRRAPTLIDGPTADSRVGV